MDRDMIDKFSQEMARQYQTPNAPDTEKPDAEKEEVYADGGVYADGLDKIIKNAAAIKEKGLIPLTPRIIKMLDDDTLIFPTSDRRRRETSEAVSYIINRDNPYQRRKAKLKKILEEVFTDYAAKSGCEIDADEAFESFSELAEKMIDQLDRGPSIGVSRAVPEDILTYNELAENNWANEL